MALLDEDDRVVYRHRLANDAQAVVRALAPYRQEIEGLVVESTYNWYWLVDALMEAGYRLHLANTAAIVQYSGLKYSDDDSDAAWLAKLLRGVEPEEAADAEGWRRAARDHARRRKPLDQQHPAPPLDLAVDRCSHVNRPRHALERQRDQALDAWQGQRRLLGPERCKRLAALARCTGHRLLANRVVKMARNRCSSAREARAQVRPAGPGCTGLLTAVSGIDWSGGLGSIHRWLETGPIERFARVGNYASYSRCVGSERLSNGKRKGRGNTKSGNKYLAWAYLEAANFAVRYNPRIKRYYQRKRARGHGPLEGWRTSRQVPPSCISPERCARRRWSGATGKTGLKRASLRL